MSHQLQFECSDKFRKMLDELSVEAEVSRAEILSRAVGIYNVLVKVQAEKGIIRIIQKDGKILEMTNLLEGPMFGHGHLLKTNGQDITVYPKDEKTFSLKELQEFVGGDIEIVDLDDDKVLVVNEEGKRKNLEVNHAATRLAEGKLRDNDQIVGDALYCDTKAIK